MTWAESGVPGAADWRPLVTALVPTYNGAAFISRTLDCIAAQTWANLEILIGDDRSTDDTASIVRAFAAGRSNVRVVERDTNLGWLRNSNDLMANASGELMFFAFHDDVVAPTYVERLVGALRDRPVAILAFSDMTVTEPDGECRPYAFDDLATAATSLERGLVMARRPDNWWVPNRGLFRSEAFARIGGIHPNACGEYSADWTWLLHMVLLGEFVRVPEPLCDKFYQHTSLSKRWPHDDVQRRALRRAGVAEVRHSPLGPVEKARLVVVLTDVFGLPARARRGVKRLVKRVIKRP